MRHNKKINHLSRKSAHRKAMLSNMASSLIETKRITTTVAKAKALRTYVEPLITKAKNDTTHSRRIVFRYLQNKNAVSELFRDVADKVGDRPGGYTRILRTGTRYGDNAEMCIIELVDYNEAMLTSGEEVEKTKRRRSRRGGGSGKKGKSPAPQVKTKMEERSEKKEAVTDTQKKPKKEQKHLTDQITEETNEGVATGDSDAAKVDKEKAAKKEPAAGNIEESTEGVNGDKDNQASEGGQSPEDEKKKG